MFDYKQRPFSKTVTAEQYDKTVSRVKCDHENPKDSVPGACCVCDALTCLMTGKVVRPPRQ